MAPKQHLLNTWLAGALGLCALGCGFREGAPQGSPGHVSEANQACASLFCSSASELEGDTQCEPSCLCGAFSYAEPEYDEYHVTALLSWQLVNPPSPLPDNPYEVPSLVPEDTEGFCAAVPARSSNADRSYSLETFKTIAEVEAIGGQVTHRGACGACSSLQDLAVYMSQRDLSSAGKKCGMMGTFGTASKERCFRQLGFTDACAQIWGFNVRNTRDKCFGPRALLAECARGSAFSCAGRPTARHGPAGRSGLRRDVADQRPCTRRRGG